MIIKYRSMEFQVEEIDKTFRSFSNGKVSFDLREKSKDMAIIMGQAHIDLYYKNLTKI